MTQPAYGGVGGDVVPVGALEQRTAEGVPELNNSGTKSGTHGLSNDSEVREVGRCCVQFSDSRSYLRCVPDQPGNEIQFLNHSTVDPAEGARTP